MVNIFCLNSVLLSWNLKSRIQNCLYFIILIYKIITFFFILAQTLQCSEFCVWELLWQFSEESYVAVLNQIDHMQGQCLSPCIISLVFNKNGVPSPCTISLAFSKNGVQDPFVIKIYSGLYLWNTAERFREKYWLLEIKPVQVSARQAHFSFFLTCYLNPFLKYISLFQV